MNTVIAVVAFIAGNMFVGMLTCLCVASGDDRRKE